MVIATAVATGNIDLVYQSYEERCKHTILIEQSNIGSVSTGTSTRIQIMPQIRKHQIAEDIPQ